MHVHSAWYVLGGIKPADIVDHGEPAVGVGEPISSWTRVEGGYVFMWRSAAENNVQDAAWTSDLQQFSVAAYVLDDLRLLDAMGGSVVGAAGPFPPANLSLVERWTAALAGGEDVGDEAEGRVREVRIGFAAEPALRADVLALRYQDEVGTHVVDLAHPRSFAEAIYDLPEGITGATLRLDQGIVNVFDDNQVFLGDVPPQLVPGLVTAVGLALWGRA